MVRGPGGPQSIRVDVFRNDYGLEPEAPPAGWVGSLGANLLTGAGEGAGLRMAAKAKKTDTTDRRGSSFPER